SISYVHLLFWQLFARSIYFNKAAPSCARLFCESHSPTHDPQSSIISLCARWAGVSARHADGWGGSYIIKAATLAGIVRSTAGSKSASSLISSSALERTCSSEPENLPDFRWVEHDIRSAPLNRPATRQKAVLWV